MSISPTLPGVSDPIRVTPQAGAGARAGTSIGRTRKNLAAPPVTHFGQANFAVESGAHRQAELFYLQKQIHARTPMVIVLEDGERVEGVIEWYDRNSIKVRGRARSLVYKSAIKYMFKHGESA
jgi:sRNA-binding regulator protein Hfq